MPAKTTESEPSASTHKLASWARQGIESFVSAQKILLDLTAQQNALVFGMIRERLSKPAFEPRAFVGKFADEGIESITKAGKILLDLAGGETALVVDGLKEGVPLPGPAAAAVEVVRHRIHTLIDLQKHLLNAAAEQAHAVAESLQKGKGLDPGASVAELARRGIESFVETEKKFLDLAAHEVTTATRDHKNGSRPTRERYKILAQVAREGVETYIEAQKKLLDIAIDQFESVGKATGESSVAVQKEARASLTELTTKSVHNFVAAQKSLIDLANPTKKPARRTAYRKTHPRPRHAKHVAAHTTHGTKAAVASA